MKIKMEGNMVDFNKPVNMTKSQREKFIHFFENLPGEKNLRVREVIEPGPKRKVDEKEEYREWEVEELSLLLTEKDNEEISNEIGGRSSYAVQLKRGQFVPQILAWAREKGYTQEEIKRPDVIREHLQEKD